MQEGTEWIGDTHTADASRTITLTVLGGLDMVKSIQDVGKMPFTEFSTLYAV